MTKLVVADPIRNPASADLNVDIVMGAQSCDAVRKKFEITCYDNGSSLMGGTRFIDDGTCVDKHERTFAYCALTYDGRPISTRMVCSLAVDVCSTSHTYSRERM